MKEENETFLERVSYAMFRYGLGLYLLSGMVSLLGFVGSFLLKRFSWYWGLPFVVCGILFLVVFPPFCCEGAPAFRCGEESQLSFFHITRNVVLLEI